MLCLFFNLSGLSGLSGASIVVQDSDAQISCHLHCTGEKSRCYAWCIVPEHSKRVCMRKRNFVRQENQGLSGQALQ